MEKNNQLINQQQGIVLSTKEQDLARILFRINQLVTFSLDGTQIEDWAISVNKLHPGITAKTLDLIIDRLMTGEYEWNHKLAIQNVFNGIKEYKKELKNAEDIELNEAREYAFDLGIPEEEALFFLRKARREREENSNE